MATTLWSKYRPGTTAEPLGLPDHKGLVPAYITDPAVDEHPFAGVIVPDEWSPVEIVPAPLSVPDIGYIVMYGDHPEEVSYKFCPRETEAAVESSKLPNSFGYAPVVVQRYCTIPPSK